MAKNPMQRKAQNSFLLGMLVTLLVTGIVIGFLIIQLTKITKQQKEEQASMKQVYVVATDVNSGDAITIENLTTKVLSSNVIPSNALTATELDGKSNITDENGNLIKKANVISKINLKAGTIITTDMVKVEGEVSNDVRKIECNAIQVASQITTGKYIDVRLRLPSGADYIVVSHKKIEIPTIGGIDSTNTIWLELSETEILTLNCAIVESYKISGSLLYVTEYVEPGLQENATVSYSPNNEVYELIQKDPNCVQTAVAEIINRNRAASRNPINTNLNNNSGEAANNVVTKTEEEITKMQEERQKYLESLGS